MLPTDPPPPHCDVLVVGAGPAGSACAQWLARAGLQVVLVDQQAFPRDKVCGDGLIPDAHRAFERLGVHDAVMAAAQPVAHVGCIGGRGGRIDVPGRLAVLPRRELDDILKRAAERAGARFHAPWRFDTPLLDGAPAPEAARGDAHAAAGAAAAAADATLPRVVGARLRRPGSDSACEVRARWVVLATGAVPKALQAAGVCLRHTPSAVALRGYIHHPGLTGEVRALEVVWHKALRKGYGWIFPGPGAMFNIGVGLAHSHTPDRHGRTAMVDVNLHALMQAFGRIHPAAGRLLREGQLQGGWKGAPLRCSLEGAQAGRSGLLVTGEAVGSTYDFTGEGIGKAMETGLLAAEALLAGWHAAPGGEPEVATRIRYAQSLAALKPRFDLYRRASRVNEHPWLADLLIWRARHSPRILQRMAGVLEETGNPGNLVSLRGIARLFLPLR